MGWLLCFKPVFSKDGSNRIDTALIELDLAFRSSRTKSRDLSAKIKFVSAERSLDFAREDVSKSKKPPDGVASTLYMLWI